MRLTLIQFSPSEDKRENLRRILDFLGSVHEETDLAVLPEFCMGNPESGPNRRYVEAVAEPLDGEFVSKLAEKAEEIGSWLVANVYERVAAGEFYDTCVVLDDTGNTVTIYRKVHLFDAFGYRESSLFKQGDSLSLFKLKGFTIGLAICFDLRFPELFRAMALRGAELFVVPSAWYRGPNKRWQWRFLCAARASENVAYLAATGNASKPYIGNSLVVDPYGSAIVELSEGEGMVSIELDRRSLEEARRLLPLLELRRPSIYG